MNKGLYFITFLAGGAIGSAATWFFAKKYFESIANDEIESVKESFAKIERDRQAHNEELARKAGEVYDEMKRKIDEEGYNKVEEASKPYVIPPDQFDEAGYTTCSLTYYADGMLVDNETDRVMLQNDIDVKIGTDWQHHFGEFEDDAVYIRNDDLECDFEILKEDVDYHSSAD